MIKFHKMESSVNYLYTKQQDKFRYILGLYGDRGSTVVKVMHYKSEGCWFDPSWCRWIFH